jgi:hypothetical protein
MNRVLRTNRQRVKIDPQTDLIRLDGIIVCKRVTMPDGSVVLQFKDSDRIRSNVRGAQFVEIPLLEFIEAVGLRVEPTL